MEKQSEEGPQLEIISRRHYPAFSAHLGLSPRELQIAVGILRGRSFKSIAADLGISPHTVDGHTRRLYQKLGVRRRSSATRRVLKAYWEWMATSCDETEV
jgi:DNA-binding CsgD family transcriptional regulator